MYELEKQTFLFSHKVIFSSMTLFFEGTVKYVKEMHSKVCYAKQNENSLATANFSVAGFNNCYDRRKLCREMLYTCTCDDTGPSRGTCGLKRSRWEILRSRREFIILLILLDLCSMLQVWHRPCLKQTLARLNF